MANTFTLTNPPIGFTITPGGVLSIDQNAPNFSGSIVVSCSNGINATTATIEVTWTTPTTVPMFSETGQFLAATRSKAAIELMDQTHEVLNVIKRSSATFEVVSINILTAKTRSTATIVESPPVGSQITAAGLTWSTSFWNTGFGAYVPDFASAKYVEVYYVLGPSPTDSETLSCKPAIQAELLNSVRSVLNTPGLIYYDCIDSSNEFGEYSALYYFEKP